MLSTQKERHLALAAVHYQRAAEYDEMGMTGPAERARRLARLHKKTADKLANG